MYEHMTPEMIQNRILGRLVTDLQTREGSFTRDIIAAASVEISELYHTLDAFLPAFYVDETSGQYIDRQAAMIGITRKPGTNAVCDITFYGAEGASVPAGTPFYTASGLAFYLERSVTVRDGTAVGRLTASEPGDIYNISAGEIVSTLRNYSGISGYENEAAEGGADQESDAALLARYLGRMRKTPTSGNPWHYQMWALEVTGVGAARIISKWNGPGTVKVILADPALHPASAAAVEACAAHIEAERPVGPSVKVEPAKGMEIGLETSIATDGSISAESVKEALSAELEDYLRGLALSAFGGSVDAELDLTGAGTYTVLYNRVAFLLLSIPGVLDYNSLILCGGTENISISADTVPVLGEVVVV